MARKWFYAENTSGLAEADLSILNRAARHVADRDGTPSHRMLVAIRTLYQPGMSADELTDLVLDAEGRA